MHALQHAGHTAQQPPLAHLVFPLMAAHTLVTTVAVGQFVVTLYLDMNAVTPIWCAEIAKVDHLVLV